MYNRIVYLLFILLTVAIATQARREFSKLSSSKTPSDLRRALFKNYDAKVIPTTKGKTVPLFIGFQPIYIRELDEEKELVVLDGWITMNWTDPNLAWNPEEYDGINSLNLPSEEVWKPDISAYTSSPDMKLFPIVATKVILYNNGQILWVPPYTIYSRCPLNHKNYPYDQQTCIMILGSWTYGSHSIDFNLASETISLNDFQDANPNWSLSSISMVKQEKIYPCCPDEAYDSANVTMKLTRRYPATNHIAYNICMMAVILSLVMFFLPADSREKIVVGVLAEVLMGVTLLYLGVVVQAPAAKLIAGARVFEFMKLVAVFILTQVFVIGIANRRGPCRPPRSLMAICKMFCQPFENCFSKDVKNEPTAKEEWYMVATAMDKLLLLSLLVVSVAVYKYC